jgi:hypothetical protein
MFDDREDKDRLDKEILAQKIKTDSPEFIISELTKTEKEIAFQSMRSLERKLEKERSYWEKVCTQKEAEILKQKAKLDEAKERIVSLEKQISEQNQETIERLKISARELEIKKKSEEKKWQIITEEVRAFRESEKKTETNYLFEQGKNNQLKRKLADTEFALKEQITKKDEEIYQLKESIVRKEEETLKQAIAKAEEINKLNEQLLNLGQDLENERKYNKKYLEKKEGDITNLQKAINESIIQINELRLQGDKARDATAEKDKELREKEDQMRKQGDANVEERHAISRAFDNQKLEWEKEKQGLILEKEYILKDTQDKIKAAQDSARIHENQLLEEQKSKQDIEAKLTQKDAEIEQLSRQKNDLLDQWQKMLNSEKEQWEKDRRKLLYEFEGYRNIKEGQLESLQKDIELLKKNLNK